MNLSEKLARVKRLIEEARELLCDDVELYRVVGAVTGQEALALLSEVMQKSPNFQRYVVERAAAKSPISVAPRKAKLGISIYFDEVEIAPRGTRTVTARIDDCLELFRAETFKASESPARSTTIVQIYVGRYKQMATSESPHHLTALFAKQTNRWGFTLGIKWDTWKKGQTVTAVVHNLTDQPAKWSAEAIGLGLVESK